MGGGGWNGRETCKASYTYGTLYCTPFRYSYGCFGFRFDFLCCYTQRKQPQLCTSKAPPPPLSHIGRPRWRAVLCRAVPCCAPQTEEEVETIFFSLKNQPLFTALHRLQHYGGKNYRRKRLFATTRSKIVTILKKKQCSDALLELSNKAYSWWGLKTIVRCQIIPKHFLYGNDWHVVYR